MNLSVEHFGLYPLAHIAVYADTAAVTGRFADKDLLSILDYQAHHGRTEPVRCSEDHSLQPGTSAWSSFGNPTPAVLDESDLV